MCLSRDTKRSVLGNSTHGKGAKCAGSRIVLSRQSSLPVLMQTLHAALWLHGVVGPALKSLFGIFVNWLCTIQSTAAGK
jgi:hypothetical protein